MTSVLVSGEAASRLGAILDEADELAESGRAASAVLIAGTVLEYFGMSPLAGVLSPEQSRQISEWRQLRNQVAHDSAVAPSVRQARQVIDGIRQILAATLGLGGPVHRLRPEAGAVRAVKGKYSGVPTSSGDFIKRKHEEIDLEDRG
jgi:hypothetical protein